MSLDRSSANGASAFMSTDWPVWKMHHVAGDHPVFPPQVIVRVKALACELPRDRVSLCPVSVRRTSPRRLCAGASSPRSAAAPCGDGSTRMPCVPGITARGSSRATRTMNEKPTGCWICIIERGTAVLYSPTNTSCVPMRRPASRPACVHIPRVHLSRAGPHARRA